MITPDNLSIETLGLPPSEEMIRHFPEARERAIVMMETSDLFYSMPEPIQHMALSMFITGYVSCCVKNWRGW